MKTLTNNTTIYFEANNQQDCWTPNSTDDIHRADALVTSITSGCYENVALFIVEQNDDIGAALYIQYVVAADLEVSQELLDIIEDALD